MVSALELLVDYRSFFVSLISLAFHTWDLGSIEN